jgi:hypothetical protein
LRSRVVLISKGIVEGWYFAGWLAGWLADWMTGLPKIKGAKSSRGQSLAISKEFFARNT